MGRCLAAGGAAVLVFSWLAVGAASVQGDSAKGKKTYDTLCVGCHGETGKGDGPAATALNPKPKDLSNKTLMSALTDAFLYEITAKGGAGVDRSPLMPGWNGTLKEQDIWDVVAYMRSLAK